MAYSGTVAARRSNRKPLTNIPRKNLFVADKILEDIWKTPLQIGRGILPYGEIKRKFDEIVKPSAMHTKEGHLFEAKAVVWNNPFKPLEVSDWGELNNIGGGGTNIFSNNKTTRVNARTNRETKFKMVLGAEEARCLRAIKDGPKRGAPPPPRGSSQKVRKEYWNQKVIDWENAHPENARPDGKPTWDPDANDRTEGPATKGNRYMPLLFKNKRAYFISPKFSTVELRGHLDDIFKKGKGQAYIELDGLIHYILPNGSHKFIVLELKKQLGASGFEDAQQMRKAAVLLRKWGLELTGRVPIVELYFAAGAADAFSESTNGYQYKSEREPVQDWPQSKIETAVKAQQDHLVYIRSPIMLLTGLGLADLLRMDHWRMAKIRETLSEAQDLGDDAARYFKGKTFANFKKYLVKKIRGGYEPIDEESLKNSEVDLYIDIGRMAREDRDFRKHIPSQWLPNPTKIHPSAGLARVAEGLVYINALKRKLASPNTKNEKKPQLKKNLVTHIKYLLSPKYRPYIKNNQMRALRANLTAMEGRVAGLLGRARGALGLNAAVASPTRNSKFYSRIFKQTALQPVTYFKLPANMNNQYPSPGKGNWRTKQAAKFKFGPQKIRGPVYKQANLNNNGVPRKEKKPAGVLPEYLFKGVANINFGNVANLTPNKISNVDDYTMARWMEYIIKRLKNRTNLNENTERVYRKLINSAKNVYARPVANLANKERMKRNMVKQMVNNTNAAFGKFLANRAAPPAASVERARATPRRGAAVAANTARAAAVRNNENNGNNGNRPSSARARSGRRRA